MSTQDDPKRLHDEAHAAFHRCWTAAVGTPGYNKADWKLIEQQLHAGCRGGCMVTDVLPLWGQRSAP